MSLPARPASPAGGEPLPDVYLLHLFRRMPVLRAAESISLHFTRTESEVHGARGKEGMKEFDGALPSSFLLLELLLELLKKK